MRIVDIIQEKTRDQYVSIVKLWIARLSGSIQQKPLQYFVAGVLGGMFFVMLAKLLFPLALIGAGLCLTIYFIAPEKKL